ncbi:hypothetical protein HPP92_026968 [Vanilla planifolia]|uniref:Uncharacterized protein n=1 Tax=Vanilla planifolia TaxID=51239 RepID=A0A835U710_VANPL|nr:hypothetical protein HPP92_026968 [Vanilla planifolia]
MASWRETTCFLLLLVLLFLAEVTKEAEARPIGEGYAKVLQSLGCRCCDGEGGLPELVGLSLHQARLPAMEVFVIRGVVLLLLHPSVVRIGSRSCN